MSRATSCAAAFGRTRRLLPALLVPALVLVPAPGAAQAPGFEQGLFEIIAERLPRITTVALVDSAGSVLLPLEVVAQQLGFTVERHGARLTVPRREGRSALLDLEARTLRLAGASLPLAPAELVSADGVAWLRTERIAQLFEADVAVDFARLAITITRPLPFPAQQRVELEQRRALLQARDARRAARAALEARESTASGFGILDWDVATSGLDPASLTTGRFQLGVAVLGGGLTGALGYELGRDVDDRVRETPVRYHRAFAGSRWIAQAEAGAITTHGMFARFVRGAEITNAPYLRDYDLGELALRPDLPPGWQYEVLQGNQLLGWSEGGTGTVPVPLRLGATPVEVRMYGPAGEALVQRLVYQAPVTLLERGRLEYTLGGGVCPRDECDGYGHGDLRWGAARALTVGGGAEYFADTAGRDLRPYALASFTTGTRLTGELQVMPDALYRGTFVGYVDERTTARLHADISRPGFGRIAAIAAAAHRYDVDAWLDRTVGGGRQLRVSAGALGRTEGPVERWRTGVQALGTRGVQELRYDRVAHGRDLMSARVARYFRLRTGGRQVRPSLGGLVASSRIGVEAVEANATVQPLAAASLALAARWHRTTGVALSLGWNSRIGAVQGVARVAAAETGAPTSTIALSGSAALSPDGRLHGESLMRVGYGGVRGTAFLDRDADGVLGPGDVPLPGIPLLVAGARAVTGADGRYRAWGQVPYTSVRVAIDSLHVADPSLTLARALPPLRIIPNTAVRHDIPLVRTRELAGSFTAGPGVATTAGLGVELFREGTEGAGAEAALTATTFSDGSFYISRVAPGHYRLAIAPSSLAAIDAAPVSIGFEIPASEEPLIELAPVLLTRR